LIAWQDLTSHFLPILAPFTKEVFHAVWCGALLEMNGGTKTGFKVQTASKAAIGCVPASHTNRRRRMFIGPFHRPYNTGMKFKDVFT
jgi:hypothetical protein